MTSQLSQLSAHQTSQLSQLTARLAGLEQLVQELHGRDTSDQLDAVIADLKLGLQGNM